MLNIVVIKLRKKLADLAWRKICQILLTRRERDNVEH